jgi:ribosomal protein S18 acetylase RimI-like enzyme
MIALLDHHSESVANAIYDVFQLSYSVEASLVGVDNFPPLQRDAAHIQSSTTQFLGYQMGNDVAAVVEYSQDGSTLCIDSLVVQPKYFRRGLASQLMRSLLSRVDWQVVDVETAAANGPAITLYQKLGFAESEFWRTADGIDKVRLMKQRVMI